MASPASRLIGGTTTYIQSGLADDGTVKCLHGQIAIRLQAKTEANPGRWFYKCNNQEAPCKFFKWEDQLMPGSSPQQAPSQSSYRPGPSTPQSVSRFGNDAGRTLGSPPMQTSPSKRPAESTTEEDEAYWSAEDNDGSAGASPLKKFKFAPPAKQQQTPDRNTWNSIKEDPESSPAQIRAALELFGSVADRIERLERKLLAAERSSAHKAKRISELEDENKKLKDELLEKMRKAEVLESTIDAFRAGR
ncbi:hypothetical protein CALCODRAFT_505824 [Calocera cornea HHB12733]|uniref:GRF-type domain-containing protein n=1 Tax=Calocera cornea HHB12733 TaxID=1353952 RepID=A0A165JKT9_9BASI|nr:hypothetical protein CALCODRAFT_505824 [Calocera cornea HHB12733]